MDTLVRNKTLHDNPPPFSPDLQPFFDRKSNAMEQLVKRFGGGRVKISWNVKYLLMMP